ncbi:hypothetical protein [Clostridioides difficile]|uniref:hypothetical protein n=1 Tax=Clostridioides difficile TaxID=1496 RepID=UPI001033DE24|nr:hypothetical protein [Clostridioides difficile]
MLDNILNAVANIINFIINAFASVINFVLSVFPDSPFLNFDIKVFGVYKYLQYLAWLIPIKLILSTFVAWLSCMLIYYVYSVVSRWIKLM